jgi:dTDP-4-dehydrorhamnose reductase
LPKTKSHLEGGNPAALNRDGSERPGGLRVLIFGASGLLGKYLLREWTLPDQVLGLSSRDADIRDPEQVRRCVQSSRPDWIVLAAAYTDVDGCETNPQLAMDTNFRGALNVATAARENRCRLLFISSDYVFDGTKSTPYEVDDPVNPQSVYGHSKAEAERGITDILPDRCIVRTSWVFGTGGKCFPDTILKLAATRELINVVDDQRGCPTYAHDLAKAIIHLCRNNVRGTVHATNAGDCTWFEFASEIIRRAGLHTTVLPTTTDKFPRPAKRPKYSVLSCTSLNACGIVMPDWKEALSVYLSETDTRK